MSASISTIIKIEVKNGDAFPENRLSGSSNTGTYFLASGDKFEQIKNLMSKCKKYNFDYDKVNEFKLLFSSKFFDYRTKYKDEMSKFICYCNEVLTLCTSQDIEVDIRNNDNRYFFRFKNNDEPIINYFRHMLYGEFTSIVLEFSGDRCLIYPIISNYSFFDVIHFEECEEF